MPTVKIEVSRFSTKKQRELLNMLKDRNVLKQANTILKDYINAFVPKQSGKLRRSAIVTHQSISWGRGLPYARYQYNGQIYGPNFPIIRNGRIVGWYSRPGSIKHPTGRMMSAYTMGSEWMGYNFGYNEPGTGHHWDQLFNKSLRWKAQANRDVTAYLKQECGKRGLKK